MTRNANFHSAIFFYFFFISLFLISPLVAQNSADQARLIAELKAMRQESISYPVETRQRLQEISQQDLTSDVEVQIL